MTQQIIDIGANANDGTGEPLREAFQAVNENFANIWAAGPVGSQVVITTNLISTKQINLDLRLAGNGIGNIAVQSSIVPSINSVYDLGTANKRFAEVYGEYFYGNARFLTGISSTFIKNGNSIVEVYPSANVAFTVAGAANVMVVSTAGVDVAGNITAANFIGNVIGNISGNISVPGANTQVIFNTNGIADAAAEFTFDKNSHVMTVAGTVSAVSITGDGSALSNVMSDRGSDQTNWDTMTQMGVYVVNRTSWSGTIGTPLDSQIFVGLVEVKNSTGLSIVQVYSPGTVEPDNVKIQWNRDYWDGVWTQWIKMTNDQQQIDGGGF